MTEFGYLKNNASFKTDIHNSEMVHIGTHWYTLVHSSR